MAGENKSDNKLFQLIMVVVTTVVAPVSVYFITHSFDASSQAVAPTTTLTAPVDGLTTTASPDLPLVTSTAALPAATAPGAAVVPGILNPVGVIPAGEPGIVNGIAVWVEVKEVQLKDGTASIQIHARNQTSQTQMFTYRVQSLAVEDGSGHALDVVYGEKGSACTKKDLSTEKKIELAPNQEIILRSVDTSKSADWCAANDRLLLPLYRVTTKDAPDALVIQFNGFGPFKGFGFKVIR